MTNYKHTRHARRQPKAVARAFNALPLTALVAAGSIIFCISLILRALS